MNFAENTSNMSQNRNLNSGKACLVNTTNQWSVIDPIIYVGSQVDLFFRGDLSCNIWFLSGDLPWQKLFNKADVIILSSNTGTQRICECAIAVLRYAGNIA